MAHRKRLIAFVTGLLICLSLACASLGATAPKSTATKAAATSTPTPTTVSVGAPNSAATATDTPTPATDTPTPTAAATEAVTPSPTPTVDLGATATAFPSQTGTFGQVPSDIPVLSGAIIVTANDQQVIYNTDADAPTLIQFYKDQMAQNGWTYAGIVTTKLPPQTSITFTKAKREADVSIIDPPGAKQRLVSIVIVTH